MSNKLNIEKAQKELARARKSLLAAKMLLENELFEDCASRAYYAVMHAAKAALAIKDIEINSHVAVKNQFGLNLVKTGIIEKEYAEILNLEYESREIGDYEIDIEITRDLADERVNLGSKFVLRMEKFINENA